MEIFDLINYGKAFVEGHVEKALELVRVAEAQYRKALETYNFIAELVPFPLPKLGGEEDPYEPYEPPPAPAFQRPTPVPPPPKPPAPAREKAAAQPALKIVEAEGEAPPEARAAERKPAPKKVVEAKTKTPAKAAKTEKKGAEVGKKAPKAEQKTPDKAEAAAPITRGQLGKMRKAGLQKLCREHGIDYKQTDTNAVMVERILEKLG